jgi:hypothetical protein
VDRPTSNSSANPQPARAFDLLGVFKASRSTLHVASHARRIRDLQLTREVVEHEGTPGTSNGSAKNKPNDRTVVNCNASPSRL